MSAREFPPDLFDGLGSRRHCLLVALAWSLSGGHETDAAAIDVAYTSLPGALTEANAPACTLGGALLTLEQLGLLTDVRPLSGGWWQARPTREAA